MRRRRGSAFLLLASLLSGWTGAGAQAVEPGLTIATLGTSLTARRDWQDELASVLERCTGRSVAIAVFARSGATSDWALGQLDAVVAAKPDAVLVEYGVNDAALDKLMSRGRSEANMRTILRALRAGLPSADILVMTMNPAFGPRGWLRPFRDGYEAAHARVAAEEGARHLDLRPAWLALPAAELRAALPDGLHPTREAARRVIPPAVAAAMLGRPCP